MDNILKKKIRMIIREELYSLVESPNRFDPKKVLKLIPNDKFLSYEWKKIKNKYRGSKEVKGLD